jgi:hypothetical protein
MPKNPTTQRPVDTAYDALYGDMGYMEETAPAFVTETEPVEAMPDTPSTGAPSAGEDAYETRERRREAEYERRVELLNRPLDRSLIKQRKGFGNDPATGKPKMLNYLEHHTVTRQLNTIFGPGRWGIGETKIHDFFDPSATDGIPRAVRVTKRLEFTGDSFEYSTLEMTGYSVVRPKAVWENGRQTGEVYSWGAYEMALGNAEAKAFKRAAAQLGEALGLSLYSDDPELPENASEGDAATPSPAPAPMRARGASTTSVPQEPTTSYGNNPAYCDDCGTEIRGYTNRNGKTFTTDDLVNISRAQANGRVLCLDCRRR